jgi:hypothetical protein
MNGFALYFPFKTTLPVFVRLFPHSFQATYPRSNQGEVAEKQNYISTKKCVTYLQYPLLLTTPIY